jgi:hypothetical protein
MLPISGVIYASNADHILATRFGFSAQTPEEKFSCGRRAFSRIRIRLLDAVRFPRTIRELNPQPPF